MGICIYMNISKSVKKKEWERAYEETLRLAKAFPLAERRRVKCKGIETICLTPSEEHTKTWGWNNEKTRIGWWADGDYEIMRTAETYFLPRDLVEDEEPEPHAGDALLGVIPSYTGYDWEDPLCSHTYSLWGAKTQGEPYHLYLLAVACLIEARLGKKAFFHGDITQGQCRRAVELANKYLDAPIDVPDCCSMERFYARVSELPLTEKEKLSVFENMYLGTKDAGFGEFFRRVYNKEICDEYWKEEFENSHIGTIGFNGKIRRYLLWGFDLEELCPFINYHDKDGVLQYEEFVRRILDTKVHRPEKNCEDILEIDQGNSYPYSIYTLMAQFAFAGARNKKVDRYISIEEVRRALKNGIGSNCDVDSVIDAYLDKEKAEQPVKIPEGEVSEEEMKAACEQDASETFRQIMEKKCQSIGKEREEYDVSSCEGLLYYEKGDTVQPEIIDAVKEYYHFYRSLTEEEYYKDLMQETAERRCRWLVEQNRSILIRDKDWDKIFTDIQTNRGEFARYYPMVRVRITSDQVRDIVVAIGINDEFYNYCKSLAES